jgi:nitrous oxide reductase accessory protein NosL
MVVREQPAPRGQVVHADGERVFLCSIGDLVMYLRMPSIHGSTLQSYVEVLEAETSLSGDLKKQWPWVFTQTASFVAGVDRKRSMGEPMLAYGDVEAARVSAEKHHGEVLGWQATFERLGR